MNNNNNNNNNEYNSKIFYKIFHNKILRSKIFEYIHIFNILSFSRDRISCEQLKNFELNEITYNSYYTRLSIHCVNEDELFDLLDTIDIPSSIEKLSFSFNSIRTDIQITTNYNRYINNSTSTSTSTSISSKLKVLPTFIKILNFQITTLNNEPSINLLKEIESKIIPEDARLPVPVTLPNQKYSNTIIPFTLRITSLKVGPWFSDAIKFGWIPIDQRIEKITFSNQFNNKIVIGGLHEGYHLREINFGDDFNMEIDTQVLPNTLETIYFGLSFNSSLKKDGVLPKSITCIKFAKDSEFNSGFNFKHLKSLNTISFGRWCSEKLTESILPSESLTRLSCYNPKQVKSIKSTWFKKLNTLKIKNYGNQRYDGEFILDSISKRDKSCSIKSIPSSVEIFRVEGNIQFNQDIVSKVTQLSVFPTRFLNDLGFNIIKTNTSIKHLKLYLKDTLISDQLSGAVNIQSLEVYGKFNQSLNNIKLPPSLRSLKIKTNFNQSLGLASNSSIQIIELGSSYQQIITPIDLPSSLTVLNIDSYPYRQDINKKSLPSTLKCLSLNLIHQVQLGLLPDTIESLDISFQDPKFNFSNLKLPPSIKLLSLHHNLSICLSSTWLPNQIQNIIIKNGYFTYENDLPSTLESIYIPYLYNIPDSILNDKLILKYIKIITNNPIQLFNKLSNK